MFLAEKPFSPDTMSTPYLSSYTESYSFARGMTRAGVAGKRASSHLVKALAEIDGLFAGLNYMDKTDSWKQKPDTAGDFNAELDADLLSEGGEEMQLPHREKAGNNANSHQSQTSQAFPKQQDRHESTQAPRYDWSSIRDVKEGSEHLWQRFEALADNLDQPAINKIRNKYNDAKGLRETGVFTFRDTLSGTTPRDLRQVFAFASLSFVISCLLCDRGRIAKTDILSGIRVWRDAIQDDDERKAFVELARELWPEASQHFHFIDLDLPPQGVPEKPPLRAGLWTGHANDCAPMGAFHIQGQQLEPDVAGEPNMTSLQALSGLDPTASNLLNDWSQTQPVYNPFSNDYDSWEGHLVDLTTQAHETYHWSHWLNLPTHQHESTEGVPRNPGSEPGYAPGPSIRHPPNLQQPYLNDATHMRVSMNTSFSEEAVGQCESLRDTTAFKVILLYLHQLSSLLHLLSGQGLTAKTSQSVTTFNDEQQALKKMILEQYLDPLANSQISVGSQARAILAVAKKFVKLGHLQNFSEVQDYMITVGKVRFPPILAL